MPRRRKRKREGRLELTGLDPDLETKLRATADELGVPVSRLIRDRLTESFDEREYESPEERHAREQYETRLKVLRGQRRVSRELAQEAKASARVVEGDRLHEERQKEQHAKTLLRAGRSFYEVSKATGLPQSRLIELQGERHQEDAAATSGALRERERSLGPRKPQSSQTDRDIRSERLPVALSGDPVFGTDEDDDYEPGDWRQSSLHLLSTPWGQV